MMLQDYWLVASVGRSTPFFGGMVIVIPPLVGILIIGIQTPTIGLMTIPYGNNGSLDPGRYECCIILLKLLQLRIPP